MDEERRKGIKQGKHKKKQRCEERINEWQKELKGGKNKYKQLKKDVRKNK